MNKVAILAADIINSSALKAAERSNLYVQITEGLYGLQSFYSFQFERFKGDEFQFKSTQISQIFELGILFKLLVKSIHVNESDYKPDVRISIAIGEEDISENTLRESDGEAYIVSGRALASLKGSSKTIELKSNDQRQSSLEIIVKFVNFYFNQLTPAQCKVLFYKLLGNTEKNISHLLKISQPTINQHAKSGNFTTLVEIIESFKNLYHNETNSNRPQQRPHPSH